MVRKIGKIWYTDFYYNGQRIRRKIPLATRKDLADQFENDLKRKYLTDQIGLNENKPIPVADVEEKFYNYIENNLSPLYLKRTKQALSLILPPLKAKFIDNITEAKIEKYKETRQKKVSVSTVNIELNILKVMLNRAVLQKWIPKNPVPNIILIKNTKKKTLSFLSKREVKDFLKACPEYLKLMVKVMVSSGMRIGETIYLEWKDIDFSLGQIKIRNKPELEFNPKNKKERVIPVPDDLLKELKAKRKKSGFVFPTKDGNPRKNNIRREFLKAGGKAGLEKRVHPHLLRHTYASHLAMAGVDLPTIKELMGHSKSL
jgi:integrase